MNDDVKNHIKTNIAKNLAKNPENDQVLHHYLSSLESVKESDLVQLKILVKTENKTATKYLISNFPKAYYNDMYTWVLKQENSHITPSSISDYLNNNYIYSAEILQAPSTKLYKYFFLDSYDKQSFFQPQHIDMRYFRAKYEIWLDLEDKEYYQTSFKYCIYGGENSIDKYQTAESRLYYYNLYLKNTNTISRIDPILVANTNHPSQNYPSEPYGFYLNKYIYIGLNDFNYTEVTNNINSDIMRFRNIHTYEIYSDCPFDIMRSGYLDERKETEIISNVFGDIGQITLNPTVLTGDIINQKFNKYNLDDISKKLSSNQYSMFYDYKNPINKTIRCMYIYDFDIKTDILQKSFIAFDEDSFLSETNKQKFNDEFIKYNITTFLENILKKSSFGYFFTNAVKQKNNIVEYISSPDSSKYNIYLDDNNSIIKDIQVSGSSLTINQIKELAYSKYQFVYTHYTDPIQDSKYNIKFPFYFKDKDGKDKISIYTFDFENDKLKESALDAIKSNSANITLSNYSLEHIEAIIKKNIGVNKYFYTKRDFDAMIFELWEPACPYDASFENALKVDSWNNEYDFKMIKRQYAIPKNKDIQKDQMYKNMIESFQNNAFRETKDLMTKSGFNIFGAQINNGENSMDEFFSGSMNDNFFVLTAKPEERFAFFFLNKISDKDAQIYILDPCLKENKDQSIDHETNIRYIWYFFYMCRKHDGDFMASIADSDIKWSFGSDVDKDKIISRTMDIDDAIYKAMTMNNIFHSYFDVEEVMRSYVKNLSHDRFINDLILKDSQKANVVINENRPWLFAEFTLNAVKIYLERLKKIKYGSERAYDSFSIATSDNAIMTCGSDLKKKVRSAYNEDLSPGYRDSCYFRKLYHPNDNNRPCREFFYEKTLMSCNHGFIDT